MKKSSITTPRTVLVSADRPLLALSAALAILSSIILHPSNLCAAVPLRWTVESSRVQPAVFDVVHGESIELEAAMQSYGKPLSMAGKTVSIFWQTNGMDSAWWSAAAQVKATNILAATFTPAMDPGSPTVTGFIGATGDIYRAAFTLRFRKGPGAVPNVIEQPPRVLDLAHTVVINPPWPTDQTIDARIRGVISNDNITAICPTNTIRGIVSNTVTKAYVESLGISGGGGGGTSTNDVSWIITNHVSSGYLCTISEAQGKADAAEARAKSAITVSWDSEEEEGPKLKHGDTSVTAIDIGALPYSNGAVREDSVTFLGYLYAGPQGNILGVLGDKGMLYKNGVNFKWYYGDDSSDNSSEVATKGDVSGKADAATVNTLQSQVSAIGAHLNAEDAHFVSTNYDSVVHMPEAYVEIRMSNSWITIWKEMTRWTKFVGNSFSWDSWGGFHTWGTNVTHQISNLINTKAERCWGIYDSETGGYSPEGYTQISSSNILIAAGMSYQRTITTGGSVWVLQCNQGTAHIGGDTNGFFRIKDGDGVTQFEVVKGNKQEMGADATGISVNHSTAPATLTIPYSVVAEDHPTIQVCTDLSLADWKSEDNAQCAANVTWSGQSGAWIATVQGKTSPMPKLFVKATYMSGGETYIHNIAPVGMDSIILNGTKYYLGTAVISGNTVLTLSTTAPVN